MLKKRQPHQSIIRGDESNEETLGSSRHIPKRHRTLDVIEPVLPSTSDQNSTHLTRSRQSARSQSFTRPLTRNSKHSGASLRPQSSQPQSVQPPPNYAGSQVSGNSPTETGMASPRLSSVTHRSFGDFHNNDADKDDFQETQTQDSQIPQRALRELSSNTLNRPKHRSTRKSTVRELEVSDFDVLSDKSYQDLRKILKTSYK
ncbi:hypothetical protein BX666DRAFT_1878260 [Dichotomocladium elegans]|nr:hypothetical protein BX666DRAFT_1878260 [Dichotomocladium elegans]